MQRLSSRGQSLVAHVRALAESGDDLRRVAEYLESDEGTPLDAVSTCSPETKAALAGLMMLNSVELGMPLNAVAMKLVSDLLGIAGIESSRAKAVMS